jgi:hypothetical protein
MFNKNGKKILNRNIQIMSRNNKVRYELASIKSHTPSKTILIFFIFSIRERLLQQPLHQAVVEKMVTASFLKRKSMLHMSHLVRKLLSTQSGLE